MAEAEGFAGLDTRVAHPARVYDYWLGGTNNFAADREAASAPEGTVSAHGAVARKPGA